MHTILNYIFWAIVLNEKQIFFTKQNIRTGASLNLNSNMKTKTHIQFFSSNFDVLLEQNNPDLAVPFSSKQHITYCVHHHQKTRFWPPRSDFYNDMKIIWKLFDNWWEFIWESVQWFIPTNLSLLSRPMMWWQHSKLSSFKMNDLWSTCRFWLTHRAPHPSPKDCCVMGT